MRHRAFDEWIHEYTSEYNYRDGYTRKQTMYRKCVFCGAHRSSQSFICKSRICKMAFKLAVEKTTYGGYNSAICSDRWDYSGNSGRRTIYYIFPSREEMIQKYNEVKMKSFFLDKLSEKEFQETFKTLDANFCQPCKYQFKLYNYEESNNLFNTLRNYGRSGDMLQAIDRHAD